MRAFDIRHTSNVELQKIVDNREDYLSAYVREIEAEIAFRLDLGLAVE